MQPDGGVLLHKTSTTNLERLPTLTEDALKFQLLRRF